MSNELLTMSTQSALDLSRIHNAALLQESQALDNLVSQLRNKASTLIIDAESIRREQAIILDRIQSTELYKKDGFKSLAEYGDTIGLGKSTTYALSRVGHIYNDKKAPDAIKALSPSNLDTLTAAIKSNSEQVYKDAELGALDGMSQSALKDYAKAIKPTSKSTLVKTYQAFKSDRGQVHGDGTSANCDYTIDEWEAWYSTAEFYKIPKDKNGNIRFCLIDESIVDVITLKEYKPNKNGKVKSIDPRAEFISKSMTAGTPLEMVDSIISMMGWNPLTEDERDAYNQ